MVIVLLGESDSHFFATKISEDSKRLLSAESVLELMIVIETKKGETGGRELDLLLHRTKIDIVPFDNEQAEIARVAWRQYGKSNHKAALNFGDCVAYALAKVSGEPLLFKGKDFSKTDIRSV